MKFARAIKKFKFRCTAFALVLLAVTCNQGDAQETNTTNALSAEKPTNAPVAVAVKEDEGVALPTKGTDTNVTTTAAAAKTNIIATANALDTNVIATAKPATTATALTLDSFRLIAERNIFDQSREPRSSRSGRSSRGGRNEETRRAPRVESFALVGTMSYEKGTFAFFDGSSSQYRKTLQVGESIGTYQVKDVAQNQVKLASEKQELELKVGQQLRREDEGEWQVSARSGEAAPASTTSSASGSNDSSSGSNASSSAASGPSDSGGASDLLKRLMQQREKELTK